MNVHTLQEYESRELRLEPATIALLLQRHRRHLELRPLDRRDMWQVTSTSMVGTVNAGTDVFHIRPKARLTNLLAMMDVEISSETWHREVAMLDDDPDLFSVMARLFCVACEHATARGIRRAYQARSERLVSPAGSDRRFADCAPGRPPGAGALSIRRAHSRRAAQSADEASG